MSPIPNTNEEWKIDFSFFPSITNIRQFALLGRNTVEMIWPQEKKFAFEVEVCLIEALTNVYFHARDQSSHQPIRFQLRKKTDKLIIRVFDRGKGFSLAGFLRQKLNPYRTKGRGLQLIQGLTDRMVYIRGRTQNELFLEKTLSSVKSGTAA